MEPHARPPRTHNRPGTTALCGYAPQSAPQQCHRYGCVNPPEVSARYNWSGVPTVVKLLCSQHAMETADRVPALTEMTPGLAVSFGAV